MEDLNAPAPAEQIITPEVSSDPPQPPAPPQQDAPVASRREALEKAFKGLDEGEGDGQQRGPDGRFVAKEPASDAAPAVKADPAAKTDLKPEVQAQEKGPLSEAPSRFSADAKAAWAQAPDAIKGEVRRAISELESGLQQKDAQLAPLKPFFDMAKQHGVEVHDALGKYVAMEQLLARDMRAGLQAVAQNFGLTLDDMIAKVTGGQNVNPEAGKDREILSLRQEIADLKGQMGQVSQSVAQQRETSIFAEIQAFAETHPRLDELSQQIVQMIQTGFAPDLKTAYDYADRLNPAPRPAAPAAPPAPPQTRQPLSVTGAPPTGSNPVAQRPSASRREALERAAANLGF